MQHQQQQQQSQQNFIYATQQSQQNNQVKTILNTQQISNSPKPGTSNSTSNLQINPQQIINLQQQQQIKTEPVRTATPTITTQVLNPNNLNTNGQLQQQNLTNQQQRIVQQPQSSNQQQQQQASTTTSSASPSPMDLLKCLKKFLHTLLDLANNSLPEKYPLVRNLIQDLLVSEKKFIFDLTKFFNYIIFKRIIELIQKRLLSVFKSKRILLHLHSFHF